MINHVIEIICHSSEENFKEYDYKNFGIDFVPLWQNTEEQEANIRRTVAETDAIYINNGVLEPSEIALSRFGGSSWSMDTEIDVEDRKSDFDENELVDQYDDMSDN